MALFWCISGLIKLPIAIYALKAARDYGLGNGGFFENLVTSGLTESIGPLIASLLLFYGAGLIANILAPKVESDTSTLNTSGALRVGVVLVAIWTAAQFLPGLLGALARYVFRQDLGGASSAENWPIIVSNTIGLGIVVVAILFAVKLDKAQR